MARLRKPPASHRVRPSMSVSTLFLNREGAKLSGRSHASETVQPDQKPRGGLISFLLLDRAEDRPHSHNQQDLLRPIPEPGSEPAPGQQNDHRPSSTGTWASGMTDKTAGGHTQSGRCHGNSKEAVPCSVWIQRRPPGKVLSACPAQVSVPP